MGGAGEGRGGTWAAALLLGLLLAGPARAGSVFLDADRSGARDPGEAGVPGVLVSDGVRLVETGSDGSYDLDPGPDGFVFLIRPSGFTCERWWSREAGDFALVPERRDPRDFFFVQISDAHVYDRAADFREHSLRRRWWLPDVVADWLTMRVAAHALEPRYTADFAGDLRAALLPTRSDAKDLGSAALLEAYLDEFSRPGSRLGDVSGAVHAALSEVAALEPTFVVSTGDLVLESNLAPPEVVERWMRFYREETRALGIPFYETIGNNEIAGSENEDFDESDPRYGKAVFQASFGPSYFAFDRGPFHFVALDTHWRLGDPDDADGWVIDRMSQRMARWLEADLARHRDRVLVVLNHEPFVFDPQWPFPEDPDQVADDQGLFARYGVDYVLAGHTHFNGFARTGGTTHIVTGALSGFRWLLPPETYPRGYRLFYAWQGRLYSAWKRLGKPALGFVEPPGDPDLFPASARDADLAPGDPVDVVAVAADRRGAFAQVRLELDGQPLPSERWGDYFVHARLDPGLLEGPGRTLSLVASDAAGRTSRAELALRPDASGPAAEAREEEESR